MPPVTLAPFLAERVRAAARVTIGDGQKTVMDLKLGGGQR